MLETRSKLEPRTVIYDRIVNWAWQRYSDADRGLIALGAPCRFLKIVDLAGGKYLGLRQVYPSRPLSAFGTLKYKKALPAPQAVFRTSRSKEHTRLPANEPAASRPV